jgi:hypothetical protein
MGGGSVFDKKQELVAAIEDYGKSLIAYIEDPEVQPAGLMSINGKVADFFNLIKDADTVDLTAQEMEKLRFVTGSFHKAVAKRHKKLNGKMVMNGGPTTVQREIGTGRTSLIAIERQRAETAWDSLRQTLRPQIQESDKNETNRRLYENAVRGVVKQITDKVMLPLAAELNKTHFWAPPEVRVISEDFLRLDRERRSIATYNTEDNSLTFDPTFYKLYVESLKTSHAAREAIRAVGHELGHAFLNNVIGRPYHQFNRRIEEGCGEILGIYTARVMAGLPTDNTSIAADLIEDVLEDASHFADSAEIMMKDMAERAKGSEDPAAIIKYGKVINWDVAQVAVLLSRYTYPKIGLARFILEHKDEPLSKILTELYYQPHPNDKWLDDYLSKDFGGLGSALEKTEDFTDESDDLLRSIKNETATQTLTEDRLNSARSQARQIFEEEVGYLAAAVRDARAIEKEAEEYAAQKPDIYNQEPTV